MSQTDQPLQGSAARGSLSPYYDDGRVTIYHGDALDVLRQMPDQSVDALVTDPPYKITQEYSANADPDNLLAVASIWPVTPELWRICKPGALAVVFYDTRILPFALHVFKDAGWKYLRALTFYRRWGNAHKLAGWMSTSDFALVFAKPGAPYSFNGPWHHDTYVRASPESHPTGHPAQKPLELVRHIVGNVTPLGGIVLDPFMGSGTTMVAAAECDRRSIGVELEARWCDVTRERLGQGTLDLGEAA